MSIVVSLTWNGVQKNTKIPVRTERIIFQHAEWKLFSPSNTADISSTVMLPHRGPEFFFNWICHIHWTWPLSRSLQKMIKEKQPKSSTQELVCELTVAVFQNITFHHLGICSSDLDWLHQEGNVNKALLS